jgi:hypothetical protein
LFSSILSSGIWWHALLSIGVATFLPPAGVRRKITPGHTTTGPRPRPNPHFNYWRVLLIGFNLTCLGVIVWSVKSKIKDLEGISEIRQRLIFQGQILEDDLTLYESSNLIEDGSTVHLVFRLFKETTVVFVRTVTGNTIKVVVGSLKDTIQHIKTKIERQYGIPANKQRLIFDGRELEEDWRTLQDYDVERGYTLFLVLRLQMDQSSRPYRATRIIVNTDVGKSVPIDVCGSDTIRTLKTKISIAVGMPIDEQCLKLESWVLEQNERTLCEYDIPKDSTLYVTSWQSVFDKVGRDGLALRNMDIFVRAKKDIVLVAVTQNGLALGHASAALCGDRKVVLKAVSQNSLLYIMRQML